MSQRSSKQADSNLNKSDHIIAANVKKSKSEIMKYEIPIAKSSQPLHSRGNFYDYNIITRFYNALKKIVESKYHKQIDQAYESAIAEECSYDEFYLKLIVIQGLEMKVIALRGELSKTLASNENQMAIKMESSNMGNMPHNFLFNNSLLVLNKEKIRKKLEDNKFDIKCLNVIEDGFYAYMEKVIKDLIKVWNITAKNDDIMKQKHVYNQYQQDGMQPYKKLKLSYVPMIFTNPIEEFNNLCQMDLEEQRINEAKIQNKEVNQAPPVTATEQNVADNANTYTNFAAKRKKQNEDDFNEIFKILQKTRQEKMKDNDSTQKNTEDQNRCIELFAKGAKDKGNMLNDTKTMLNKRETTNNDKKGEGYSKNLTMKHLIFYLENHERWEKSKLLHKAYFLASMPNTYSNK